MRRILFDIYSAQPAGSSKYHGGGEDIKAVFKYLIEDSKLQFDIAVFYDPNKFIDEWIIELLKRHDIPQYHIKNTNEIKGIIENNQFDVFYSGLPYYLDKCLFNESIVVRGTIHGLRAIELPIDSYAHCYAAGANKVKLWIKYKLDFWHVIDLRKRYIVNSKKYIDALDEFICDSNYTMYSLIESYPEMKNKRVQVLYAPLKINSFSQIRTNDEKYILLISGNRWEKNSIRAIRALDDLISKRLVDEHQIVVVGIPFKGIENTLKNKSRFTFKGYIKTDELEQLYANCDLFVYPTLNEGFGLPPIEAMKYGKTCVVSSVCSLPEIYGDTVYWINPYDVYEIQNRVLMGLNHKINQEHVLNRAEEIMNRQKEDLKKICEFIVS